MGVRGRRGATSHSWQGVNFPECSICLQYMAATRTRRYRPAKLFVLVVRFHRCLSPSENLCRHLGYQEQLNPSPPPTTTTAKLFARPASAIRYRRAAPLTSPCLRKRKKTESVCKQKPHAYRCVLDKQRRCLFKPSGDPVFGSSELRFFPPPCYLTRPQTPAALFRRIERTEPEMI